MVFPLDFQELNYTFFLPTSDLETGRVTLFGLPDGQLTAPNEHHHGCLMRSGYDNDKRNTNPQVHFN